MAIQEYVPTNWVNDSAPPINAANLNHIEQGLKNATDGVNANGTEIDNLEASIAIMLPPGSIIMWWGTVVPEGWVVCDGINPGTPNLIGRFPMGRDASVFATAGGSATSVATHSHSDTFTIVSDTHTHGYSKTAIEEGVGLAYGTEYGGTSTSETTVGDTHTHTLSGGVSSAGIANGNLPPYRTVMFIMKT